MGKPFVTIDFRKDEVVRKYRLTDDEAKAFKSVGEYILLQKQGKITAGMLNRRFDMVTDIYPKTQTAIVHLVRELNRMPKVPKRLKL